MGAEELLADPDHGLFVRLEGRQRFFVAQGFHQVRAETGPFAGSGMGIPDVLAVQFTCRDQHGQFLDMGRQGGRLAQVR